MAESRYRFQFQMKWRLSFANWPGTDSMAGMANESAPAELVVENIVKEYATPAEPLRVLAGDHSLCGAARISP